MTKPDQHSAQHLELTPDQQRRRRGRSLAIAGILSGLVVIFFVMTIVRLGALGGG
ncbi:MAG: hypothetical protein ACTSY1_06825 [Alphaproteobacteria bacterium]